MESPTLEVFKGVWMLCLETWFSGGFAVLHDDWTWSYGSFPTKMIPWFRDSKLELKPCIRGMSEDRDISL